MNVEAALICDWCGLPADSFTGGRGPIEIVDGRPWHLSCLNAKRVR